MKLKQTTVFRWWCRPVVLEVLLCRLVFLLWLVIIQCTHCVVVGKRIADDKDLDEYLYHDEESSIILDYDPSNSAHLLQQDKNDHRPNLLYDRNQGPRVVEFYAPWCPHCRHFRTHYVEFAKQVTAILKESNYDGPVIQFCAFSCTVNKKICVSYDVSIHFSGL